MFRNAPTHNTCSQMRQFEHTSISKIHIWLHTRMCIKTHTRNFTDSSPYRSYASLRLSSSLFFCVHCISPLPLNTPPSVVFFLQGLCFPLPTVMLISAVIRREGLNAAFLTNPLRQTHRAEQSRTERQAHAF